MSPTELLERVRLSGVEVWAVGNRLRLRPASRLTPELIKHLRVRKPEVLAEIISREDHEAGTVGPWTLPGVTRHCPRCGGGLQPDDLDEEPCFSCRWPGASLRVQ